MWLFQFLRRLTSKFKPQTVNIIGFGEASNDRYGIWYFSQPLVIRGQEIGFSIQCKEQLPGASEVAFCRRVADGWSDAWASGMSKLRQELHDDGPNGEREQFLANVRPVHIEFTAGLDQWEIEVEPDIYGGHIVTMLMNGLQCENFRLDG